MFIPSRPRAQRPSVNIAARFHDAYRDAKADTLPDLGRGKKDVHLAVPGLPPQWAGRLAMPPTESSLRQLGYHVERPPLRTGQDVAFNAAILTDRVERAREQG